MKEVYIRLRNVRMVKNFVAVLAQLPGKYELIVDRKVLDARSILGIFTLDLTGPILLRIESDADEHNEKLKEYVIGEPLE